MNRVQAAIDRTREKIKTVDAQALTDLDKALAVDFDDHFQYQEIQAQAHAEEKLTTEEAQIIYIALGEVGSASNGGWATGADLATKSVVTTLMGHLLAERMTSR